MYTYILSGHNRGFCGDNGRIPNAARNAASQALHHRET